MTVPSDFESYCNGVVLRAANYSGGAGGTFTDLVTGNEDWSVVSATPSFSTQGGISGMDFSNSAAETVLHELRALREVTFVCIGYGLNYLIGGNNAAANTFGLGILTNQGVMFQSLNSSGPAAAHTGSTPIVIAGSLSPVDGKSSVTTYDGTLRKASMTAGTSWFPVPNYWQVGIGRHRTTYFTGWISEVHIFSRSLHRLDETALDQLITDLGATVGI